MYKNKSLIDLLWDTWCLCSIIGIWPRFIEPQLLTTREILLPIQKLDPRLSGLRIVQISDLHIHQQSSPSFFNRAAQKIKSLQPDLIVCTGDLINYGTFENKELLIHFLKQLSAPLGVYATLGNHDYSMYVTLGENNEFVAIDQPLPAIVKGMQLLTSFQGSKEKLVTEPIPPHEELLEVLDACNVTLLNNQTVQVGIHGSRINLSGLGDIMAHDFVLEKAFQKYDSRYAGIVLSHNPDSYDLLKNAPGDLFLFGHTHGGQVNIPFLWSKLTPIRTKKRKRGLLFEDHRFLYINRGLSSPFPFRWFSLPEITCFSLISSNTVKEKTRAFQEKRQPNTFSIPAECPTSLTP